MVHIGKKIKIFQKGTQRSALSIFVQQWRFHSH
jgi:hypothetical protein